MVIRNITEMVLIFPNSPEKKIIKILYSDGYPEHSHFFQLFRVLFQNYPEIYMKIR